MIRRKRSETFKRKEHVSDFSLSHYVTVKTPKYDIETKEYERFF